MFDFGDCFGFDLRFFALTFQSARTEILRENKTADVKFSFLKFNNSGEFLLFK